MRSRGRSDRGPPGPWSQLAGPVVTTRRPKVTTRPLLVPTRPPLVATRRPSAPTRRAQVTANRPSVIARRPLGTTRRALVTPRPRGLAEANWLKAVFHTPFRGERGMAVGCPSPGPWAASPGPWAPSPGPRAPAPGPGPWAPGPGPRAPSPGPRASGGWGIPTPTHLSIPWGAMNSKAIFATFFQEGRLWILYPDRTRWPVSEKPLCCTTVLYDRRGTKPPKRPEASWCRRGTRP